MSYPKNCLLCRYSETDYDAGYGCSANMWDYFCNKSRECPKFVLDKGFAIENAIQFFESSYFKNVFDKIKESDEGKTEKEIYRKLAIEALHLL